MSDSVSATLAIEDNGFRYAEVERRDDRHRLSKVGTETFPFDLSRAVLREEGDQQQTRQVREALEHVFEDTTARNLRLAVHPPQSYSFFTPISSDVPVRDRKRQLLQQATLVTGIRSEKELHITTETVRTMQDSEGEPYMWVHVLAIPDAVNRRVDEMLEALPVTEYTWIVSSEAASRVMSRVERTGGSAQEALRPYTLAVGQYSTHTEYSVSRNREWYHSHYAEEAYSSDNRAYYAVGFLNRVDVPLDGVGRLFVYGTEVDLSAYQSFQDVFGQEPEALNPFRVVDWEAAAPPDDPGAFAPCIGAGMGDYFG